MTNEEYHAAPGISSTQLNLLQESALHLFNAELFKFAPSESMSLGTLVHMLTLEPELFDNQYAIAPTVDKRTTAGKNQHAEFTGQANGKLVITQNDFITASKMAGNVKAIAGNLVTMGVKEQSYFVDDDGLTIKCRPDCYHEQQGIVVDLKTTSDISEFGLKKSIATYRYDRSAAFYLRVLRLLNLPANRFILIFVSSTAPHMVKIREMSPGTLEAADYEIENLLENYREFLKTKKCTNLVKQLILFGENNDD